MTDPSSWPVLTGLPIVTDPGMTESRLIRRERKWSRRVRYQRHRRFDDQYEQHPSRQVIRAGNSLIMHPDMLKEIERNL